MFNVSREFRPLSLAPVEFFFFSHVGCYVNCFSVWHHCNGFIFFLVFFFFFWSFPPEFWSFLHFLWWFVRPPFVEKVRPQFSHGKVLFFAVSSFISLRSCGEVSFMVASSCVEQPENYKKRKKRTGTDSSRNQEHFRLWAVPPGLVTRAHRKISKTQEIKKKALYYRTIKRDFVKERKNRVVYQHSILDERWISLLVKINYSSFLLCFQTQFFNFCDAFKFSKKFPQYFFSAAWPSAIFNRLDIY